MAAVCQAYDEQWDPQIHGERRGGVARRRRAADAPEGSRLAHDRRFGLGRRWEDWCRPAAVTTDGATASKH